MTCLFFACDPTPGVVTGGGGGRGGAGGGGSTPSLVGNWRNVLQTVAPDGEVIVVETQWAFRSDASCERTVLQTFVSRGQQFMETTACTYTATGTQLSILYQRSSVPATFPYRFSGDDLIIDGFRFVRF